MLSITKATDIAMIKTFFFFLQINAAAASEDDIVYFMPYGFGTTSAIEVNSVLFVNFMYNLWMRLCHFLCTDMCFFFIFVWRNYTQHVKSHVSRITYANFVYLGRDRDI